MRRIGSRALAVDPPASSSAATTAWSRHELARYSLTMRSSFAAAQDRRRKGVALLRIRLAYLARGERDDPHAAATNPG
jgi:hypothetical protein